MDAVWDYEIAWLCLYSLQLIFNVAIAAFIHTQTPLVNEQRTTLSRQHNFEPLDKQSAESQSLKDSRKKTTVFAVLYSLCRVIEFSLRIGTSMWVRYEDLEHSNDRSSGVRFTYALFFGLPMMFAFFIVTTVIVALLTVTEFISNTFPTQSNTVDPVYVRRICHIGNIICAISTLGLPIFAAVEDRDTESLIGATAYLTVSIFTFTTGAFSIVLAFKLFEVARAIPEKFELYKKISLEMVFFLSFFSLMMFAYGIIAAYQAGVLYDGGSDIQVHDYPKDSRLWILYLLRALEYFPIMAFIALLAKRHFRISQEIKCRLANSNI
eukprot:TRINITY_DN1835_c0_g3_i1.p1 TRINITY_DN1835_c0_g3~~TRINITY_DN1835_c0_g3_i1.p1  ORF type:complete len:323 (+),score=46.79 TRINITY_DN1835_c0_g3_i1:63-1031(+)